VEGGGNAKPLKTACRNGFSEFLKKSGTVGHNAENCRLRQSGSGWRLRLRYRFLR
jgi:uncharacterized protein YhjY with autotransporter beta-barrel domain